MNSLEIKDKKEQIKKRMSDIVSNCKKEIRTMTEEEQKQFDDAKSEIEQLNQRLVELENELQNYQNETDSVDNIEELKNKRKNNTNTKMEFKLLSAINDIANNRNLSESAQEFVNAGIQEMRKAGQSYSGQIVLPLNYRSAITATGEGTGIENVSEDKLGILEPLRAKNILAQAGANFLTGLVGDLSIPVMSASNVTWEGENGDAKDGAGSFTEVKLSPKRLTAYVDVSKQFLIQDSNDAEAKLKNDIVAAINSKLESTILSNYSGSTTQPAGIFATVPYTGTTTTFAGIADLGVKLDDANVLGEKVYVLSNSAKAKFRTTSKGTGNVGFILEGGEIDGEKTVSSSNVMKNGLIYGDFSNLSIGQWGGIDLVVDPYTQASKGMVRLVINAYFDAKVVRPEAFVTSAIA
jgi:HK97 family phage major capsid protein